MNNLIIASAGAGKTERVVCDALERSKNGQTILIVTYTENNQQEILDRICEKVGARPNNIHIKGWFSFLLSDYIRPYQNFIFRERIAGINFNDSDPHKVNGLNIYGRAEKKVDGSYNHCHYLTGANNLAHTMYLSKLAVRVCQESGVTQRYGRKSIRIGRSSKRLEEIYDVIFIDEVQDLVGWDYELIKFMSVLESLDVICVGDFRQTIYRTSNTTKDPRTNYDKYMKFQELDFEIENLNVCHRCIQAICDFSDSIYKDNVYPNTMSQVDEIPEQFNEHQGVFIVRTEHLKDYIRYFNPVILRNSKRSGPSLLSNQTCFNFGKSKGLGFSRILIFPTDPYCKFLAGDSSAFAGSATDQSVNKLYVATTRAKYSVAFLYDGEIGVEGVTEWIASLNES